MSAVGSCADNAAAEGFFGMLKRERVNRRQYVTRADARADVFDWDARHAREEPLNQQTGDSHFLDKRVPLCRGLNGISAHRRVLHRLELP